MPVSSKWLKALSFAFVVLMMLMALLSCKPEGPRGVDSKTGALVSSQQTPAGTCVPTPLPPTDVVGTLTPPPEPFEYAPPAASAPSVTPLPLSKTTDLAPDLPDRDKAYVYVFRCNGTYELFLVRPADVETRRTIPLQAGDTIRYWDPPASLMGVHPPRSHPTETPFVSPLTTPTVSMSTIPTPLAPANPAREPTRRPLGTPTVTPTTP